MTDMLLKMFGDKAICSSYYFLLNRHQNIALHVVVSSSNEVDTFSMHADVAYKRVYLKKIYITYFKSIRISEL